MSALGEYKINVHAEPMDGLHMSDYDFECTLYVYTNRKVVIPKSDARKVDDDNYVVMVDSEKTARLGKGKVKLEFTAYIPDNDFNDGLRTEKAIVWTDVTI